MKVLVIPEYGSYGGTLSFFRRLLEIHGREKEIQTGILIQEGQYIPEEVMSSTPQMQIFTMPERSKISLYPILSVIYDLLYTRKAVSSFQPDLIVVSNGMPGLMLGVLFLPIPTLYVMHSYPPWRLIVPSLLMKALLMKPRYVIMTVSRFSGNMIREYMGVRNDRLEVIYNSAKLKKISIGKALKPLILTLGHIVSYKNPELWVEVAKEVIKHVPDARFVWLGDGMMLERLRQMVADLDLGNNIEFRGYTSDVEEYYSYAMIYFQPSKIENNSISVLDAMAYGLPCVTSDTGGLPESVVNGVTGYVCRTDDVEGYASRISELLSDQSLRLKMGKAARQRVSELFSEEVQERKIIDLYKRLAVD